MKKKLVKWMGVASFLLFFGAIGYGIGYFYGDIGGPWLEELNMIELLIGSFIFILVWIGSFYVAIIIHELGHLIGGLISGYRFGSFRIGSLLLKKGSNGFELKKYQIAGTGGQCLMVPPDSADETFPYLAYNLGGPLLNLAVGLLSGVMCAVFPSLMLFAIVNLIVALMNGVPIKYRLIANDAYNALTLSKNPLARRVTLTILKINNQLMEGLRLKEMPDSWFDLPNDFDRQNVLLVSLLGVQANRLFDQGRLNEARLLIDDLLMSDAQMNGVMRALLICQRALIDLIEQGADADLSMLQEKEVQQVMKGMPKNLDILLLQYASALLKDQDHTKANQVKAKLEKAMNQSPYLAEVAASQEVLEWIDTAQTKQSLI
ncbi:M50 family metallopeptidase [Atopobacter phocae]|uniref:M50 family metallopeptidase n=1 Tax=Atopobacter phocae TaxID=136492 RepID=UPI00046F8A1B|nr:M50 family metallopeptidase [Atopobacter phocae]